MTENYFGNELRSLRKTEGKTLREFAGILECSIGYLSEIERGEKKPNHEIIMSLIVNFKVDAAEWYQRSYQRETLTLVKPAPLTIREPASHPYKKDEFSFRERIDDRFDDSAKPFINRGDRITMKEKELPVDGDLVAYKSGDHYSIRTFYKVNHTIILYSLNNSQPPIQLEKGPYNVFKIKVIEKK